MLYKNRFPRTSGIFFLLIGEKFLEVLSNLGCTCSKECVDDDYLFFEEYVCFVLRSSKIFNLIFWLKIFGTVDANITSVFSGTY